ncbi:hypothetical protein B7435_32620 [Mycolicibacterium peregrinum]|uniref:hypothetical protein n=1 Tax=Mycolicibacterium peregrinum TaxID=43304 RepID=UPI000B4AC330|nr:hypothetical protein [Mycolicibacterium peregrinum]OWL93803.1 hypothetical protein B7435_32620 [Mycolicibacterium peregrinum]
MTDAILAVAASIVILVWGAIATYLQLRKAPDDSLAAAVDRAVGPVIIASMGASAVVGLTFHRGGIHVLLTGWAIALTMALASRVIRYLDRRAETKRRAALRLAPRRRLLSPAAIGACYGALALLIWPAISLLGMFLLALITNDTTPPSHPTAPQVIAGLIVFIGPALILTAGIALLVQRQRRKISDEDARIAELDRQAITDQDDDNNR